MVLEINDRIRTRRLEFFDGFQIHSKYDSIGSTFKFDFLFDPNNIEHKEVACIGHYHTVVLKDGNDTLMTGTILSQEFDDSPEKTLVSISGHSLPGVLQNCEIPFGNPESWIITPWAYTKKFNQSTWPTTLESDGLSLRSIAEKILHPFDLKMVVHDSVSADMDTVYDEITAKEKDTAMSFICKLAAQKNIVVTDDQFGRVVFTRPSTQSPIFHFNKNIPGTRFNAKFDGEKMHSHIKVYQDQDIDEEIPSSENIVENPYVRYIFRPHVAVQNSGTAEDTGNAAVNIRARELKNYRLRIETDRWRINNNLLRAGNVISITNPYVYLFKKTEWFVEDVILKGNAREATATLECVLKSVYDGTDPKYIHEGINLH